MRKYENWTNKGNDKQEDADSLLHNKSNQMFVQNFKILGFIDPEKSFDTNCPMSYFCVTVGKKKKMKINHSLLLFFYTIDFNPL